ncbi:2-aminoethylphosphonate transport system ATP-binding protein [Paraburkholderia sp. JPY158]|uniref:2-aminoethylphosphonate transport system ATP-binding protein n=1 Tax=Paraburkholderia atlantica TaxID=2654982 RepID=A0A7W8QBT1_PARAM|nr:ABC transporter ATP-binding protein [Paraburkholderia atlantica]MBB5426795.1 2-aminoethylphosphonate transport system ATP-binding protein [Paraburkholderia atlantica]
MANTMTMERGPQRRASTAPSVIAHGASGIGFEGVSVAYGSQTILESLTLTVKPGEIVALIGPSGSGKTTALRAVAGFVQPSAGRITIGDRDVTRLPPYARNIGMVVQNYALFPHMRVEDNVAFGLRARGADAEVIRERVPECLGLVGMAKYAKRYPRELSGGQQQRVAIARALAIRPQVLLLDEPLSALDAQIRRSMLDELAKLHRTLPSLTVLYVTHDQTEALTLANHIGIMRDGHLVAYGDAQGLYRHPPNRFAAEFLGRANVLPAQQLEPMDDGRARVRFHGQPLEGCNHHGLAAGAACFVCVRPHHLRFAAGGGERGGDGRRLNQLTGVVVSVQWLGEMHSIVLDVEGELLRLTCAPLAEPPEPGTALSVRFDPADVTLVPEAERHG